MRYQNGLNRVLLLRANDLGFHATTTNAVSRRSAQRDAAADCEFVTSPTSGCHRYGPMPTKFDGLRQPPFPGGRLEIPRCSLMVPERI